MNKAPNPIDVHVGARVRLARSVVGVTQKTLAEAIGVTFQQLQKYERGQNRISASRLQQMVKVLKVPNAGWFFLDAPDDLDQPADDRAAVNNVLAVLQTADGARLARAFTRITNPAARRKVVEIAQIIAAAINGVTVADIEEGNTKPASQSAAQVGAGPAPEPVTRAARPRPIPPSQWGKRPGAAAHV